MKTCLSKTLYSLQDHRIEKTLTFAFLSDLHNYSNQPVFDLLHSIEPDAVLVGGDFIQDKNDMEPGLAFLRYAASRWPIFCSSGKEHSFDASCIDQVEKTGAVFLRNRAVRFMGIHIGGLNTLQLYGRPPEERRRLIDIDRAWLEKYGNEKGYKLLLCHHPEYYDLFLREYPVDLILSGHAHGGQIRLFGCGLWAPGQGWFPKYTSGLYDGRLLVGRGIGNAHWVPRINNRPEVLEIRLYHGD